MTLTTIKLLYRHDWSWSTLSKSISTSPSYNNPGAPNRVDHKLAVAIQTHSNEQFCAVLWEANGYWTD